MFQNLPFRYLAAATITVGIFQTFLPSLHCYHQEKLFHVFKPPVFHCLLVQNPTVAHKGHGCTSKQDAFTLLKLTFFV